jgi:hypothetical protein
MYPLLPAKSGLSQSFSANQSIVWTRQHLFLSRFAHHLFLSRFAHLPVHERHLCGECFSSWEKVSSSVCAFDKARTFSNACQKKQKKTQRR